MWSFCVGRGSWCVWVVVPATARQDGLPYRRVALESAALPPVPAAEVAMQCPSKACQSSNVQLLSHYRDSLPPGSPLRDAYAPPAAADSGLLPAAGLALLGLALMLSGGFAAGLAAMAVGGLWGYGIYRRGQLAEAALTAWANRRICLACTEQWTP